MYKLVKHVFYYFIHSIKEVEPFLLSFHGIRATPDSISIPNTVHEALSHPDWCNAMMDKMQALNDNGTWDLVPFPTGKKVIGCLWVFAVKFNLDGSGLSSSEVFVCLKTEFTCLIW